jgi:hypothetical protein
MIARSGCKGIGRKSICTMLIKSPKKTDIVKPFLVLAPSVPHRDRRAAVLRRAIDNLVAVGRIHQSIAFFVVKTHNLHGLEENRRRFSENDTLA